MKISKMSLFLSTMFFLTGLVFSASPAICKEEIYRWKIQSAYPRGDLSMGLLKDFADDVKKNSNGKLLISVHADPELVPAGQLFDAVSLGTIDMLHGLGAMWAGVVPVGEVEFGLPFAYRTPGKSFKEGANEIRKFFYDSGMVDLLRKEYEKHGMYWLDMHTYGPNIILARKPIVSCNDLKGKKITVEGSFNQFFEILGAGGAIVSGTETYMALKLGTVDGAQWDISAITALNWYEVAPYWIKGGENHQSLGHILINQKKWNTLPEDLKKVLADAAKRYWDNLLEIYDSEINKAIGIVKEGKLKECMLDSQCEEAHKAAALKVWDSIGAKDPVSAQAIDLIKKRQK